MAHLPQKKGVLVWSGATIGILLAIHLFGLWPKGGQPGNGAIVVPETAALVFNGQGMAYAEDLIHVRKESVSRALTIECAVSGTAHAAAGFSTLIMIHDGDDSRQLFVGRWKSSLVVMNGDDYDHTRKLPRLLVKHLFQDDAIHHIMVTADHRGTRVHIDGRIVAENRNWKMQMPGKGQPLRLVVGNSVAAKHGWKGNVYGLALYNHSISPARAKEQYARWQKEKHLVVSPYDTPAALYTFQQMNGHWFPDLSGNDQPLYLPPELVVLIKRFLTMPVNLRMDRSLFIDTILNLVGFVPLGIALVGLFIKTLSWPSKVMVPAIVLFSFLVSLNIECTQAWMPARSSSLPDLVMNTLGALAGVWISSRWLIGKQMASMD